MLKRILNHEILKSGLWYTISNFLVAGLTFLTIPIFTRLLTTSEYGLVSLYKTWVTIFMIIISLSLTESIRRAKFDYENEYKEFASSIVFLSCLVFTAFMVIVLVFSDIIESITNLSKCLLYLLMFHAFFLYIKEFGITQLRYEYKYKAASIINIIPTVLGISLSLVFILNKIVEHNYLGRIIGESIFFILIGSVFLIYIIFKGRTLINIEYWKYALTLSLPLVIHNLSKIINNQFDIIIINHYIGQAETGIYSLAYSIGMIVTVLTVSMGQAWEPWFFKKYNTGEFALIKSRARIYRDFFNLLYICILMVSTEIIKIMATEDYWDGIFVVPWIFLGLYFQFLYSFEVNVEFAMKKTKHISIGTVFAAVINVILNLIFIPLYGYLAAAITTAVSFFLLFLFHYLLTSKVLGKKIYGFDFYYKSICYVLIVTISFIIFQDNFTIRFIIILISFLIFYKSVLPFLKNFLNKK